MHLHQINKRDYFAMRSIVVLLGFLVLSQAVPLKHKPNLQDIVKHSSKNGRVLEEPMKNFLYCVRDHMTRGIPEFDIPSFNPLRINATTIELGAFQVCTGHISVEDFIVSFFHTFEVSFIQGIVGLIPPRFELIVELTWNTLAVTTAYDLRCESPDDIFFGTGNVEAEAVTVRSLIDFVITVLPSIDLQEASFWLFMDRFTTFRITGLRDDEEHSKNVSQYFYENGAEILQYLDPYVSDIFEAVVEYLFGQSEGIEEGGLIDFLVTSCLNV